MGGPAKRALPSMAKRWIALSTTEILGGSDAYASAYQGNHRSTKPSSSYRGVDYLCRMRNAHDPKLDDLHGLVGCPKCGCANFDLVSLLGEKHFMCPRCQEDATLAEQFIDLITDCEVVIQKVHPLLKRNGHIPQGDTLTTWREPLAAETKMYALAPGRLDDMLQSIETTSPEMADHLDKGELRREGKV